MAGSGMAIDIEPLYVAWLRWDNQPTSRDAVVRLQAEMNLVVAQLDATAGEFRELVNQLRRRSDLRTAIERAVELF